MILGTEDSPGAESAVEEGTTELETWERGSPSQDPGERSVVSSKGAHCEVGWEEGPLGWEE